MDGSSRGGTAALPAKDGGAEEFQVDQDTAGPIRIALGMQPWPAGLALWQPAGRRNRGSSTRSPTVLALLVAGDA
jgi:hypothetical protein